MWTHKSHLGKRRNNIFTFFGLRSPLVWVAKLVKEYNNASSLHFDHNPGAAEQYVLKFISGITELYNVRARKLSYLYPGSETFKNQL